MGLKQFIEHPDYFCNIKKIDYFLTITAFSQTIFSIFEKVDYFSNIRKIV